MFEFARAAPILPEDVPREVLGRYTVGSLIAVGAYGAVYRGQSLVDGRSVAIKLSAVSHRAALARIEREAQLIARIVHPNVVRLFDFGSAVLPSPSTDPSQRCSVLVTELIDGVSLGAHLASRGGALPWREAASILLGLLYGLDAMHESGIVHRDIKPENIMLERRDVDVPKLIDFGVALWTDDDDITKSAEGGVIVGSLAYMSPEQLATDPIDARTDIYAAGAVLYELLTGALPFEGTAGEIAERKRDTDGPSSMTPPVGGARWPEALGNLVLTMLRRDADLRPKTAFAAAEELRALLAKARTTPR